MPEGPSIIIAKELLQPFDGKKILKATGNSRLDLSIISGKKITAIKSWGKHLLLSFDNFTIRIHFMMFGSYSINGQKENRTPRLRLEFKKGEINLYACSIKFIYENPDDVYDWTADVMNDKWDARAAKKKLKQMPDELICDALLNQEVFSGVGNIIKNEVLFICKVHPESIIKKIPAAKINELIKEARDYSFDFLKWKREYVLRKHWLAYAKKICPRDQMPFIKKYCGKTKRRTFYCAMCMVKYD